jgi:hypothetical protein
LVFWAMFCCCLGLCDRSDSSCSRFVKNKRGCCMMFFLVWRDSSYICKCTSGGSL